MHSYQQYISIDPEIRFGRPCVTGTRIAVADVLGWLGSGQSVEEIIEDFPELTKEQIQACLLYAADRERHLRIAG
ncbi:DUF433 domain-containing protein [Hymenobacter crusticola]|uniref:DUF433 domain-containing protein n=1 Tax=Hymenobacter crusticola TaxID=1770526 RepID=A0A243WEP2_9BACT|nr:DUF433 domain-containing protein [Hymenobacter crusticola]OUJ73607.1 hypothetical protein BXP70_11460 [Hymenobacter crusticola]